jgi:hypothetical protein
MPRNGTPCPIEQKNHAVAGSGFLDQHVRLIRRLPDTLDVPPTLNGGVLRRRVQWPYPPGKNGRIMEMAIKMMMIHSSTSIRRVVA